MRGRPSLRPVEAIPSLTTSRGASPALLASCSRGRGFAGVRAPTELGFAAALRAMSARSEGVEGLEEPVCGRQGDVIDESLRRRQSTSIERGNPSRERVDEYV